MKSNQYKVNYIAILVYSLCSILCLYIYFNLDLPKNYFQRVGIYYQQKKDIIELNKSDKLLKQERYGLSYVIPNQVKELLKKSSINIDSTILLLEPNEYLLNNKILNSPLPEPVVFFYHSGVKTAWMNSPHAKKATHLLRIQNNQIFIDKIEDTVALSYILDKYKNYKVTL